MNQNLSRFARYYVADRRAFGMAVGGVPLAQLSVLVFPDGSGLIDYEAEDGRVLFAMRYEANVPMPSGAIERH